MSQERKLYSADEAIHVLENTDLVDIDNKVRKAKTSEERDKWNTLYNSALRQQQLVIINSKKFIR